MKLLTNARPKSSVPEIALLASDRKVETAELPFVQELNIRAEKITSVLQEILDFHPANHWDVN